MQDGTNCVGLEDIAHCTEQFKTPALDRAVGKAGRMEVSRELVLRFERTHKGAERRRKLVSTHPDYHCGAAPGHTWRETDPVAHLWEVEASRRASVRRCLKRHADETRCLGNHRECECPAT